MALGRFLTKLIDRLTGREKLTRSPMEYDPAIEDERPTRYWPSSREEPLTPLQELDAAPDELLTCSERQMKYLMREWGRSF